jgi:hypothetical protein
MWWIIGADVVFNCGGWPLDHATSREWPSTSILSSSMFVETAATASRLAFTGRQLSGIRYVAHELIPATLRESLPNVPSSTSVDMLSKPVPFDG